MKICVCTASAAFWGPQAEAFAGAFRAHGHSAKVLTNQSRQPYTDRFDLLFCIGAADELRSVIRDVSSRHRIIFVIESIPTLKETDQFTETKLNILLQNGVLNFDYVFVHSSRSIPLFRKLGIKNIEFAVWPHFPSICAPTKSHPKQWDTLFLGTLSPYRKEVLDRVASHFSVALPRGVFHSQSCEFFTGAKIVLNIHFTPLSNLECRIPEVLGSGGFLMTERLDPTDVFLDGKHLVTFDHDNLLDRIDYYLRNDVERDGIAERGYKEAQKYTVEKFVKRVLNVVNSLQS